MSDTKEQSSAEPSRKSLSTKDAAGPGSRKSSSNPAEAVSPNGRDSFKVAKSPTQFDTADQNLSAGTGNKSDTQQKESTDKQELTAPREQGAEPAVDQTSSEKQTESELDPTEDETLAALVSSYSISLRCNGINKNHECVFHVISNCAKVIGYIEVILGMEVATFKNLKGDVLYVGQEGLYWVRKSMIVKNGDQSKVATISHKMIDMGDSFLECSHPQIHKMKEKLVITFHDQEKRPVAQVYAKENTVFLEFEMANNVVVDELSRALMVMYAFKSSFSIYYFHEHAVPHQLLPELSKYKPRDASIDIISPLRSVVFRTSCKDEAYNRYIEIFDKDSLQIALVLCIEGMTYWKFKDVFGVTQFYLKSVNPQTEFEKVSVYAHDGKILGSFERHMKKARFRDACGNRFWKGIPYYRSMYYPFPVRFLQIFTAGKKPFKHVASVRHRDCGVEIDRVNSTVKSIKAEYYAVLMAYAAVLIRDHYNIHNQMIPTFPSYPFLKP